MTIQIPKTAVDAEIKQLQIVDGAIPAPSGPWAMYEGTCRGHASHGIYWHNHFGRVMGYGGVNLPTDIAAILYDCTPLSTPLQILP